MAIPEAQDKAVMNGSQPISDSNSSKKRSNRKVNTLPSSAGNAVTGSYPYQVKEMMWSELPVGATFSVNPNGTFPLIKWSKSSYRDARTLEATTNVQGNSKVYRVFL
jgi:hypothetical protein